MPEYQLYLCILLSTRLVYLRQDEAAGWLFSLTLALAQAALLLLVFGFQGMTFAVVSSVFVITIASRFLEARTSVYAARVAMLLLLAAVPVLWQSFLGALSLSPAALLLSGAVNHALQALVGGGARVTGDALPVLAGLLLLANEVNVIMRGVFQALGLVPRVDTDNAGDRLPDVQEYNAGRIIGILERWLMFLVVLSGNDWSALGFIVAAKSLVRFDQFKDRMFAEYMLVGTFMSALFAIAVAWVVGLALPWS